MKPKPRSEWVKCGKNLRHWDEHTFRAVEEVTKEELKEEENMLLQAAWLHRCVRLPFKPFPRLNMMPSQDHPDKTELVQEYVITMLRHGENSEQYKDARKAMMELFRRAGGGISPSENLVTEMVKEAHEVREKASRVS